MSRSNRPAPNRPAPNLPAPSQESFFENFKKPFRGNWPESFHYIAITIALVVSAAWAVWTFNVFEQKNKALQELENTESELVKKKVEIKEIQERLDGNFSSDIVIKAEVVSLPAKKYGLVVHVSVKNVGTKDVVLNLENNPLTVYKLRHSEDKLMATKMFLPQYYQKLSTGNGVSNVVFPVQKVLVGASKDINFFTEVDGVGMYYLTFEASLSSEQRQRLNDKNNDHIWFASTYINVKD